MAAAATKQGKHFHITVNVVLKRTKEEVSFAEKETDKLHTLIGSDKQVDWAKDRIAALHKMIFSPSDDIKREVVQKLKEKDTADSLDATSIEESDPTSED